MNTAATPIRFGREHYAQINANLNQACARSPFVIAAHRGTPRGDIRENTLNSVLATKQVNADIAEIDVIRSTDGEYFAFHDGTEMARLRITDDILSKTAAELDELRYTEYPGAYYGNVERVAHILSNAPDILINIDRSWRYWGSGFLDWLDQFHLESKLILKCPVTGGFQQALHDHDVKYMFMGMIQNPDELDLFVDDEQINTVGVELVATTEDTPLADPAIFNRINELGLYTFVNALDLGNGYCGLKGMDDTRSILEGPQAGWGALLALGADVIQTDWPEKLDEYRRVIA